MKRFALVVSALIVVLAAAGYWYVSKVIEPKPVPVAVIDAENALGLPDTIGMLHFNITHAVEVERSLLGREDANALLDPITDSESVVGVLVQGGIDVRESVDHLLGALIVGDGGPDLVGIALGHFEVARIVELLSKAYQVEKATIAGAPVFLLTKEDVETCKVSDPVAVHLAKERIVMGAPSLVGPVLERLNAGSDSTVDLAPWRAYRNGKVVSLALLAMPEELSEAANDPMTRMATKAAGVELSQIQRVFAGASFEMLPPGLRIETRVETDDPAWPDETARAYATWKAELDEDVGRDLPTLVRLLDYLSINSEGPRLIAAATLSEEFLREVGRLPGEVLGLLISGMGVPRSTSAARAPQEEQTVPPEEVTVFRASLSSAELKPFDPQLDQGFKPDVQAGPFALRLESLRFAEGEESLVEIKLEALSGELPNMDIESMHAVKGDPRAQLFITHVRDHDGQELLRDEHCGRERNSVGGELKPTTRHHFVDKKFIRVPAVSGSKAVRLKPGVGIKDIASIEGYVGLRLPTQTETKRISAPFDGQVVEAPDVRVKFSEADPSTIKYEISGQSDRVLAIRALNGSKQYLRSAGSYASNRFLGSGKTVGKSFQGRPTVAELVVAREETVETYPFTLSPVSPRFDRWDYPKPYQVVTMSKNKFARSVAEVDLSAACEGRPADKQLKPFQLCPKSLRSGWRSVQGQFQILAPDQPALQGNLSALELRIESVRTEAENGGKGTKVPLEMGTYTKLRPTYGNDYLEDTPWLTAEEPPELKDKAIAGVQGRLVVRLPKRLAAVILDVTELGNSAQHESGLGAKLVEISDGRLKLQITGPRERIVQFVPRDAEGTALATNNSRLEPTEDSSQWVGSLSVSGIPATLDVVFAEVQDRLEYAFDLPVSE